MVVVQSDIYIYTHEGANRVQDDRKVRVMGAEVRASADQTLQHAGVCVCAHVCILYI